MAREIHFYAPGLKRYETEELVQREPRAFLPVSLTGRQCALQCDHCQGRLLESMLSLDGAGLYQACRSLQAKGTRGVLITGGSDRAGRVPLLAALDDMVRVKGELGMDLVVHTGLVDRPLARGLAQAAVDGAMLDIIGSEETIRQVYHLEASPRDFEDSLAHLYEEGVPTMPHIVLGLHCGRMVGEAEALAMVGRYPPAALVLVVLTPWGGTAMAAAQPPAAEEVGGFFREARLRLPHTPILLGCARPGGPYKETIDRLAVEAGLNGIAYPAEGIVEYARQRGLTPRFHEECCSLAYRRVRYKDVYLDHLATA